MESVDTKIQRLMTEHESQQIRKNYIIANIDRLVLEDRLTVLRVISAIDRESIKTLGIGTVYNLDKAPCGLIEVLEYTISKLLEQSAVEI